MPVHRFPFGSHERPLDILEDAVDKLEKAGEQVAGWTQFGAELVIVTVTPPATTATKAARRQTRGGST